MGLADELERLHKLHSEGGLTDEEYERAKAALLPIERTGTQTQEPAPLIAEVVTSNSTADRAEAPDVADESAGATDAVQTDAVQSDAVSLDFLQAPGLPPVETPLQGKRALPDNEFTPKELGKALEVGAVGGGVIGMTAAFALERGFAETVIPAIIIGAFVWTLLTLAAKTTSRSQGLGASLIRLLYRLAAISYAASLIYLIGTVIYVKVFMHQPEPPEPDNSPPATWSR